MPESFSFYAPIIDFEKSHAHNPAAGVVDVKLSCLISSDREDFDKDVISQDGLIFDLWKQGYGRVKYEHNKDPKYFIGYPVSVMRKGHSTHAEARIFAKQGTPQYEIATQCIGDLENMKAFNEAHPESPKRMGISVEGGILARKGKHVSSSVITNIVITANPRNPDTYANLVKSFEAGASVNGCDMTGGESGRKQYLSGSHKNQTIGVKLMGKFNSKEEVAKYFATQGYSEADAKAKAEEWESARNKTTARDKSLEKSFEIIDSAMENISALVESLEKNKSIVALEKSFETNVNAVSSHENVDVVPFMKAIGGSSLELQKSMTAQNTEISKMFGITLGMIKASMELTKSVSEDLSKVTEYAETLIEENESLKKSLENIDTGIITDGTKLAAAKLAGKQPGEGDAPPALSKKQAKNYLRKSFEDAGDDATKRQYYSTALTMVETHGIETLNKSLIDEITDSIKK